MTIQITRPELEALIEQRLQSGAFTDVEDLILHALRLSDPLFRTGAEFAAVMQSSPFRDTEIEPARHRLRCEAPHPDASLLDTNALSRFRRLRSELKLSPLLRHNPWSAVYQRHNPRRTSIRYGVGQ